MSSLHALVGLMLLVTSTGPLAAVAQQRILYDDDCSQDVDCVATLPILHELASRGEVTILAMVADSANPMTAPVFRVFAKKAGHGEMLIGANQSESPATDLCARNKCNRSDWAGKLVKQFDAKDRRGRYPGCGEVYRKALAGAPDHSVAIVETGFATCLSQLLDSGSDAISGLDGPSLVKQKVKLLSIMGGKYPAGSEWNFESDAVDYHKLFTRWTRQLGFPPVYLNGFDNGERVMAGAAVATLPLTDPTRYALALAGQRERPMWDMLSALFAVRGASFEGTPFFTVSAPGTLDVDAATGADTWSAEVDSGHYVITNTAPDAVFSDLLDGLLAAATHRRPPLQSGPPGAKQYP